MEHTKIEWCDHTFNPWEGCQKVGPGCDHCYAETRNARFAGGQPINWGPGAPRRRTSSANWRKPLKWQSQAAEFFKQHGRRQRVFCASLADVFDNMVDLQWRVDLFRLISATPDLDWLLLTKRIGNARPMIADASATVEFNNPQIKPWTTAEPWSNVWIGATVVNQEEADRDIPKLLAVPATKRFLSIEPMLGPIDLLATGDTLCRCEGCLNMSRQHPDSPGLQRIDWVICGGESGPNARPMHPDWARLLRDQCAAARVPFLFKQWGEYTSHEVDKDGWNPHLPCIDHHGRECALSRGEDNRNAGEPWWFLPPWPGRGTWGPDGIQPGVLEVRKVGKKAAGRLLDGIEHNEFPIHTNDQVMP